MKICLIFLTLFALAGCGGGSGIVVPANPPTPQMPDVVEACKDTDYSPPEIGQAFEVYTNGTLIGTGTVGYVNTNVVTTTASSLRVTFTITEDCQLLRGTAFISGVPFYLYPDPVTKDTYYLDLELTGNGALEIFMELSIQNMAARTARKWVNLTVRRP